LEKQLNETTAKPPWRRNKQRLQAVALVILLGVPGLLYWVAQAGATGWVIALLGVMTATMTLLTLLS
jgi:hypothetical protein